MKANDSCLSDHIDEPIKKAIVGLNLLGIKTLMSCCGFSYTDEKVPKKHLGKAYVYLDARSPYIEHKLITLLRDSKWMMCFVSDVFIDFYAPRWEPKHEWNDPSCPHFYEIFALGINNLTKAIDKQKDNFSDTAIIEDGNSLYINDMGIKHWQYKPAKSWIVSPEIYNSL